MTIPPIPLVTRAGSWLRAHGLSIVLALSSLIAIGLAAAVLIDHLTGATRKQAEA